MRCAHVRESLPRYRDEELPRSVVRHLKGCESCRLELHRYELLSSRLAELETLTIAPPLDLKQALVAIPALGVSAVFRRRSRGVAAHVARNRGVYLGGAALALTGAALAWRGRSRLAAA